MKNKLKFDESAARAFELATKTPPALVMVAPVKTAISTEGLAIAQRLSSRQVVIPRAFRVTAEHFSLQGQALIEGSLEAAVRSSDVVEVLAEGSLRGSFTGNELIVSGQVEGSVHFEKLHLRRGAICKGSIVGHSLVLDEGALLEASCRLIA